MLFALSTLSPLAQAQPGNAAAALISASALALWFAAALLLAFWIDRRWGEPPSRLHPVVRIGNYLQLAGRFTVRCPAAPAFVLGALAWCVGAAACGGVAWWVQALALEQVLGAAQLFTRPSAFASLADVSAILAVLGLAVSLVVVAALLKCLLSWRMLRSEVAAVEAALEQSLDAGRQRLSWLVSRDTAKLSAGEVRESAIESLAENLNDSVVAPVFWFVLFGLPGAAVYRFANTADAMWGYPGIYRGNNWQWAGKWAARADDVLSWPPARLTAGLLAMASGCLSMKTLRTEAIKTPSPNSGWPMAAMALALGVGLRKPGVYALNPQGRAPEADDTARAQHLSGATVRGLVWLAMAVMLLALPVCAVGLVMAGAAR
ncbi:MAG: adenosylcobinamide-phosphate synthase CbiB [Polaromonas sp.]|nr:adenosylcobinamide-phosphate synthase CbiB [Polaromonas sp.]